MKKISRVATFALRHQTIWGAIDTFITDNPVFARGLALTPIVVAASTLKNGVALILTMAMLYIPITVIARLVGRFIPEFLRDFIYTLFSAALFIPAYWVVSNLYPSATENIGIYLPLMVADALIVVHAKELSTSERTIIKSFGAIIVNILGFGLAAVILGGVREVLAYGTIWGNVVFEVASMPIMSKAFMGFILVGVIAAISKQISNNFKRAIAFRAMLEEAEQDERDAEFDN